MQFDTVANQYALVRLSHSTSYASHRKIEQAPPHPMDYEPEKREEKEELEDEPKSESDIPTDEDSVGSLIEFIVSDDDNDENEQGEGKETIDDEILDSSVILPENVKRYRGPPTRYQDPDYMALMLEDVESSAFDEETDLDDEEDDDDEDDEDVDDEYIDSEEEDDNDDDDDDDDDGDDEDDELL